MRVIRGDHSTKSAANSSICLGPISPPNEHIVLNSPRRPWWQWYQPISYNLCSRCGSENELRDMITRCNNGGVNFITHFLKQYITPTLVSLQIHRILQDESTTYIEYMSYIYKPISTYRSASVWMLSSTTCGVGGGEGTHSSCGSWFSASRKDFPSLPYSQWDFSDNKCRTSGGNIENYDDANQVNVF